MQTVFHVGVHGTDGDRLLKTLLNNRAYLMKNRTEVVTPNRHRGLFEEALMSLKGGRATPEMVQIMQDAVLETDAPERVLFSSPTFMGAPGRAVTVNGLYSQMGSRVAALANLFPDAESEFFVAIRNPAVLLAEVMAIFNGGGYHVLMQGQHPLDLRWRDAIRHLIGAAQGRRVVIWCHEDVPLIWPEVVRLMADIPLDVPVRGGLDYLQELLTPEGQQKLKAQISERDQMSISQRRALTTQIMQSDGIDGALDQPIDLPGWTQELVDQVTQQYHADVAEIAVLPGVEFILPR